MTRLQDKVAIVTGAASGIGLANAKLFAEEGAKVVATDVQSSLLEEEAKKINEREGAATALSLDVTSEDHWKEVVQKTVETYGQIDVLVNNAGIHIPDKILEASLEDWHKVMNVNTTGIFLGMREVIPEMQKVGRGSIINIASLAALTATGAAGGNGTAYSASKGAVRSLTKHVAAHFAEENIRANCIFPGPIKTPIMGDRQATIAERNRDVVPLPPHYGEASDIAYAALYYASEESRFVTGDETVIDGGSII
ncbi:glucose 1-dehydrogenase [Salicibibacter halophilus]|uniref:Glucose 1-dehydrogenase n=1 Tax=Salicibibacter halophilus TaxID=2502791 RepID=A0A514LG32_9BACI|nr:glucose 1-dehydrogenase [Salicibibacter halophilus]QDI90810.1 glucose 1-dehydrogenase [Salicibibacter halophilus]